MTITLRPHQVKAVDELSNGKVLVGDVGTGKSLTAVAYYVKNEAPKDVYVITTAKKRDSRDWQEDFNAYCLDLPFYIHSKLHVDSWNNIDKYADVENAFFIFDEQRLVGSGAWVKRFLKLVKKNNWILLSATPGDTWLDYIPVFVANGFYKNRTAFKDEHVIYNTFGPFPKVDRYVGQGKLIKLRSQVLVKMPYVRHTVRHIHNVNVPHNAELLKQVTEQKWNVFEEEPLKDVADMFRVARKVVNSDESRLEHVREVWKEHPRLIVFYNFNYELEALRSLANETGMTSDTSSSTRSKISTTGTRSSSDGRLGSPRSSSNGTGSTSSPESGTGRHRSPSRSEAGPTTSTGSSTTSSRSSRSTSDRTAGGSLDGSSTEESMREPSSSSTTAVAEWNGHKHEEVPTTDRWLYLVQYTAGSEGWNCVSTDAMLFYSLTYSYKQWHQAFGRIDRLNTPFKDLHYYVLQSTAWIDQAVRRSLRDKKNFNEASSGFTL